MNTATHSLNPRNDEMWNPFCSSSTWVPSQPSQTRREHFVYGATWWTGGNVLKGIASWLKGVDFGNPSSCWIARSLRDGQRRRWIAFLVCLDIAFLGAVTLSLPRNVQNVMIYGDRECCCCWRRTGFFYRVCPGMSLRWQGGCFTFRLKLEWICT